MAVDQVGKVGENRLVREVLEADRAVQGDRELDGGQGSAAAVEEVVPAPDLVTGDAEDLGPGGGQPPFGRGAGSFDGFPGQCRPHRPGR